MINLLHARCQSEGIHAMSEQEIHSHLAEVSGWHVKDAGIEKTFTCKDFYETIAFVNALAWICQTEDHHPELHVTFDRCVVRFSTDSVSGISRNDFICAAKADALVSFVG
ncbi:MAG: 4a-hydroxytetrahydrobiopterin dehydratase [Caldimonas sp.]